MMLLFWSVILQIEAVAVLADQSRLLYEPEDTELGLAVKLTDIGAMLT